MELRNSTPTNVILAEAKEPLLAIRLDYICKNFLTKTCANPNHPLGSILESIIDIEDNPTIINRFLDIPLVINYRIVKNYSHLLEKDSRPLGFSKSFGSISHIPLVDLESGHYLSTVCQPDLVFRDKFAVELENSFCLFTDGLKQKEANFTGLTITNLDESVSKLFRAPNFIPIFTVEAMALLEAIGIIRERRIKSVTIFSDSKSVLSELSHFDISGKKSHFISKIREDLLSLKKLGI